MIASSPSSAAADVTPNGARLCFACDRVSLALVVGDVRGPELRAKSGGRAAGLDGRELVMVANEASLRAI